MRKWLCNLIKNKSCCGWRRWLWEFFDCCELEPELHTYSVCVVTGLFPNETCERIPRSFTLKEFKELATCPHEHKYS